VVESPVQRVVAVVVGIGRRGVDKVFEAFVDHEVTTRF
jgi:hypothetical protein